MRFIQPNRAVQEKIQANSAWAGTWDWLNRIDRFGSSPQAMKAAASSRVAAVIASRPGQEAVIACRSTMQ